MAISSTATWEVRPTNGADTNGGLYVAGAGIDYSQLNSPQASGTDLVTSSNSTVTSNSGLFTNTMVNNGLNLIVGGTSTIVQISTYTNSKTLGVTPSIGSSGSGISWAIGGALQTPGMALKFGVGQNTFYIKDETGSGSTLTSSTSNIPGGVLALLVGAGTAPTQIIGYGTTRGDGTKCQLALAAGVTATMLTLNNSYCTAQNIAFSGNASVAAAAFTSNNANDSLNNFSVSGFTGGGANLVAISGNGTALENGMVSGGPTGTFYSISSSGMGASIDRVRVTGSAGIGINVSSLANLNRVEIDQCGSLGLLITGTGTILNNCSFDDNVSDNVRIGAPNIRLINCGSTNAGGWAVGSTSSQPAYYAENFFSFQNTSGVFQVAPLINLNPIALSALPYAGTGTFALNNTSGGGASCQQVTLGMFGSNTTSWEDLGSLGSQRPSSGTSYPPNVGILVGGVQ